MSEHDEANEPQPESLDPAPATDEPGDRPEPDTAGEQDEQPEPAEAQPEEEGFDVHAAPGGIRAALEAILMVVDEPVEAATLAATLAVTEDVINAHLRDLEEEYAAQQRGFALRELAGGWRFYSRHEFAPVVEQFLLGGQVAKLTQASLETLAVVAYRQPISRSRISAIRGVSVDGVVRTLLSRGLIEEMETHGESGAILYVTTPLFLEKMGLGSLDELPPIAPHLPDADLIDQIAEETEG